VVVGSPAAMPGHGSGGGRPATCDFRRAGAGQKLGTLPEDAPGGENDNWQLPDTPLDIEAR
jgi:hypothetical protein